MIPTISMQVSTLQVGLEGRSMYGIQYFGYWKVAEEGCGRSITLLPEIVGMRCTCTYLRGLNFTFLCGLPMKESNHAPLHCLKKNYFLFQYSG